MNTVFYFTNQLQMFEIYDKGNGKNFIGYKDGKAYEIMKTGGRFYLIKFNFDYGILPVGTPLIHGKDFVFGAN